MSKTHCEAAEIVWRILVEDRALMATAVKPAIDHMVQEIALELDVTQAEEVYGRKSWFIDAA